VDADPRRVIIRANPLDIGPHVSQFDGQHGTVVSWDETTRWVAVELDYDGGTVRVHEQFVRDEGLPGQNEKLPGANPDNGSIEVPNRNHPERTHREARYWRYDPDGDRWVADVQSGPPITVWVNQSGIYLGDRDDPVLSAPQPFHPGDARWVALRLAEAAAIYETVVTESLIPVPSVANWTATRQAEERARHSRAGDRFEPSHDFTEGGRPGGSLHDG
jgi:hypothetical protein